MNEETFRLVETGGISQRDAIRDTILNIVKTNVENLDMEQSTILTKVATGLANSRTLREFLIPDLDDHTLFNRILGDAKMKYMELTATSDVQARLAEVAKKVIEEEGEVAF